MWSLEVENKLEKVSGDIMKKILYDEILIVTRWKKENIK